MRILALIQCANLGGMEQSTVLLLDEFKKMGHEVELLSLNALGSLGPVLDQHGIPAIGLGYRGKWGWRSFLPLRRMLRTRRADALVMVGHNLMAMLALGDFCRGQRVLSLHFHHEGVMPKWAWRVVYRVAMWRFRCIIYPSQFIKEEAMRIVPRLNQTKRTISYPVPSPVILPQKVESARRQEFRQQYGLGPEDRVVGNAGWLIQRKRWDIYLQVAARVAAKIPEARFLIAGDGPERGALEDLAVQLGIQSRVRWLGWIKGLEIFFRSLDVMVFNSDWDAMGRTPLEAMSYGVPVVASMVNGGLSEILDSAEYGFLLPEHNVPVLADKVMELLRDGALAARVGKKAGSGLRKSGRLDCMPNVSSPHYWGTGGLPQPVRREASVRLKRQPGMDRVLGVLANIVPYHHARWEAYARLGVAECHVVEATDRDEFKVLEFASSGVYQRHTLFPAGGCDQVSRAALRRKMVGTLDAIRPEVVCVSGWDQPGSLAALQWASRNSVSAVMLSESNEFDEPRFAVKEFIKRQVVGVCSAGLAGGTPQAEYLASLGLPRDAIFLGYDAVDNGYFEDGAVETRKQKAESRNRYGLPERYFLASARFTEKKNLPRLIEAYAKYRGKAESRKQKAESTSPQPSPQSGEGAAPWDLVLLGDGPVRPALNSQLSTLNLQGHVHLPGARPYSSLAGYYGLASAFVHASTTEQWGLVVNEAMASGLPVLVSNRCGCAPDLVHEGVNGFTFDPYSVEQLAELMLKISAFSFPLSALGNASRRIISEWGPDRFAAGLNAAVKRALGTRPRHASLLSRALLKALLLR